MVIDFKYNCNTLDYPFYKTIENNTYEKLDEIKTEVLEHLLDKSIDALYVSPPKMRINRPYFISWCNIEKYYILESSLSFYNKDEYDKFIETLEKNSWKHIYTKKYDEKYKK